MNAKGFGLIQTMIAVAVASLVAAGIASVMVSQAQQISYFEDRMSRVHLEKEIKNFLDLNPSNCTVSMSGRLLKKDGNKTPVLLKDEDDKVTFSADAATRTKYDGLEIGGMYIEDIDVHSGGAGTGKVRLVVEPRRVRSGGGPAKLKPIESEISVSIDTTTNRIQGCIGKTVESNCVVRDSKDYAPGKIDGEFALPSDTEVVHTEFSRPPQSGNRCDDDWACPAVEIKHIIYPGVTAMKGLTYKKGVKLRKVRTFIKSVKQETCSGNAKTEDVNLYKTEWYYGGIKLVTKTDYKNKYNVGCDIVTDHRPELSTNTLPPECPIRSGLPGGGLPTNLDFKLYKNGE